MGPPGRIRGVFELLGAFEKAADKLKDICLICLFRADGLLDTEKIRGILSKMKNRNRIYTIWESLDIRELYSFIKACHAQILPFILIPSEIPLAIIETIPAGCAHERMLYDLDRILMVMRYTGSERVLHA